MKIESDSAGVRFPPPLAFLGTLLAGLALGRFLGSPGIPILGRELERNLGWILLVAGLAIILTALRLFRVAGTNPEPWKRSSALVTDGVYRWTRNPMYLGMSMAYAGIALIAHSLTALLLLIPLIVVITREVIEPEEAYMEKRFGTAYRAYRETTRRWF